MEKIKPGAFSAVATQPGSPKWEQSIKRENALYERRVEVRTPFGRDYTRILHSMAYRRLKYKSQVYFRPDHDHVSTRIDHVHYVASVGRIIATYMGLSEDLVEAIAIGHDLGHTPVGHDGERVFDEIVKEEGLMPEMLGTDLHQKWFWHGKNGLRLVDCYELLIGPDGRKHNLDLTYGVRDGIISHSGSISAAPLFPRAEAIDLRTWKTPGEYAPFTWEACLIKLADNIAYLGRDIDDARILGLLTPEDDRNLAAIVGDYGLSTGEDPGPVNNTNIIHLLVTDLCEHSSPERGMGFSEAGNRAMTEVLNFNRRRIYHHPRLDAYKDYGDMMIRKLYGVLSPLAEDPTGVGQQLAETFPMLSAAFQSWICKYWDGTRAEDIAGRVVFPLTDHPEWYRRAALDFIAGMTDPFIEKCFREQLRF